MLVFGIVIGFGPWAHYMHLAMEAAINRTLLPSRVVGSGGSVCFGSVIRLPIAVATGF